MARTQTDHDGPHALEHPPGTEKPRRVPPRGLRYELISCGLSGHELVGTDAAEVRERDAIFVRDGADGVRWHRCLRCDSWLPQPVSQAPARRFPPERDEIACRSAAARCETSTSCG